MPGSRQLDPSFLACARLLAGDPAPMAALAATIPPEEILACLHREGIVSAAYSALASSSPDMPPTLLALVAADARALAARHLLSTREAGRIQSALEDAGITCLWLKGTALRQWLYDDPCVRDINDLDLLLPDHATMLAAARALEPLGYGLPNPYIAGDLIVHELLAWSERAQLELDLHWRLSNDALFADRLQWRELREGAIELPALGSAAVGLAPVHALLHACIHRALNYLTGRENRLRWLYDIHLLAVRLTAVEWEQVVSLASSRGLAGACHDGLVAAATTFGTPLPEAVVHGLAAIASDEWLQCQRLRDWTYFQRATWRSLPGARARVRWLRQLLFPDVAHLRARYGSDGAGTMKLCVRRVIDGWRRWRAYVSD